MKISHLRWFKPIVWIIELAIVVSLLGSIISIAKKKDVVGERASVLLRVQSENERLKRQVAEAERPSFVEKEARDKLGLVKPGEVIVLVGKRESTPSGSLQRQNSLPRWQQWWQLFF